MVLAEEAFTCAGPRPFVLFKLLKERGLVFCAIPPTWHLLNYQGCINTILTHFENEKHGGIHHLLVIKMLKLK